MFLSFWYACLTKSIFFSIIKIIILFVRRGFLVKKAAIFFAPGSQEGEALVTYNVLRAGKVATHLITITDQYEVTGGADVTLKCHYRFTDIKNFHDYDIFVIPGGLKGAKVLAEYAPLVKLLQTATKEDKYVAAVCAGPMVLEKAGLLKNKQATCYPKLTHHLASANLKAEATTVQDGHIITSSGFANTIEFALQILQNFISNADIQIVKDKLVLKK